LEQQRTRQLPNESSKNIGGAPNFPITQIPARRH